MAEKILPYSRALVAQETYYNCGPASVQTVLASVGINIAESKLASELGTTPRGTDWIGQFPAVLNKHMGAGYFSVEMPSDPPKTEQKERLWRDLVASINGGRGVIANIVAPPSNYPRHVAPSTISPRYSGGTVYHYIAVMGYSDNDIRRVWIADSGFSPYGYWMSFDQLATLIPPKGYAAAPGPAALEPAPEPVQPALTAETLSAAMGATVSIDRYRALLPAFTEAMVQAGCTTVERAAMWCAQIGHESVGLKYMEELWGPTRDQLTYDTHPDLGNTMAGDGFRYKGRGPIQITGRGNYARLSQWAHEHGYVPSPTFFVDQPAQLAGDRFGFLGALWYWTVARPQINQLADEKKLDAVTHAINGGFNGLDGRRTRYERCLRLGAALLPSTGDPVSNNNDALRQLLPFPGRLRQMNRPQNVPPSTQTPDEPWPYDIWSAIFNETVWDGYDIRAEHADVPDSTKRSMVGLLQTIAARQRRIESKLDQILEGKNQ